MQLVLPSAEYKDSFIAAVKEFQVDTIDSSRHKKYRGFSIAELEKDFASFVARECSHAKGENLPPGYVPQTEYWLVDGDRFIGWVNIRYQLTEELKQHGGHIGYDIRPMKRRQGYGTKILELALQKAKDLGIRKALLTCDEANIASRKIIEKNGGVFEDSIINTETGRQRLRFWITL